ncbi:helix-turn-helix transcriptional regulator [Pseudomarimonas salicorniae]|uniref:Helix-turn-helix domain-containing protein n=1 Tax=Pseudomarimonas salicorniae TaxID=2933270 RepID=A0ABT0GLP3_9GAMM|nr:helix-turn-helix transcriptional regulator [Lysobacter sp. CAU 1642]MCK7595458.1 helix-turn-helix domain-containing protein [Lysobacter sp. CAU 1642]
MPNLASLLKSEISRLARREANSLVEPLRGQVTRLRKEVSALRKQLSDMERVSKRAEQATPVVEAVQKVDEDDKPRRFSAKRLKGFREKSGLSAPDLALLLGVSAQSIYNWENGAVRPSDDTIVALARLKESGKRNLRAALEQIKLQQGAA